MTAPRPTIIPDDAPTIASGRYALVSRIGEGGMAGVYRARDQRLRVWRAVKVLYPQFARKKKIRQRFEAEAHTMARLEHPNLVRVYDVGDVGPLPFLVMELVQGGTLFDWVEQLGPMAPQLACTAIRQVAAGAATAHAQRVVHRDIKPHNVLISPSGVCKLTDFGIAARDQGLTKTGVSMGTLGYMAPEQRSDARSVDERADIYGLGATLWTLLVGQPPDDSFQGATDPGILAAVPPALRDVVAKACSYDRANRFASVAQLDAAIAAGQAALPEDPADTTPITVDLWFEEALTNKVDYPEIRAILDTDGEGTAEPSATDPASPSALPYFMPSTPAQTTRRFSDPDPGDIPDYVDRDAMGRTGTPAQARLTDGPPADGEPRVFGAVTPATAPRVGKDGKPLPPREVIGLDPAPEPPLPVLPPRPEPTGTSAMLLQASLPIGLGLAGATLLVLVTAAWLGLTSYELYTVATETTERRARVHTALAQDRALIDHVTAHGFPRQEIDSAFMEWLEVRGEPQRIRAATRFLDQVEQAADSRPGAGASDDEVGHRVRRLRAVRTEYERKLHVWDASTRTVGGRIVVAVGAAQLPPETLP
ncbi:MAG: serine/threonine protein kinase [Myxococcales bacterium]|nr:serine/threonine protein kinase [Myxococcales bacterium]